MTTHMTTCQMGVFLLIRHDNLARRQLQKKSKNGWHVCGVVMENRMGEQAELTLIEWHKLSW